MNWAKKLLQPKNAESALPSHDCPHCAGRLIDEGSTVHCDTCNYPEPEDGFDEEGNPIEVDDPPQYCDQCGNVIPDGETWCLDVRDGTEHFCCAECQHERAAEIEAAPLCDFCHQKCTQGEVGDAADASLVFCSTECLEQYRKSTAHGTVGYVCAQCGKATDGPRYISPRHPGLKFCSERCRDDYVSKQFRDDYVLEYLNPFNS